MINKILKVYNLKIKEKRVLGREAKLRWGSLA
jgi:hypothetical protein